MTASGVRRLTRQSVARFWPVVPAIALALLAGGCSSDSKATTAAASAAGPGRVVMKVLEFSPIAVKARVGQLVRWSNEDSSPHTVTYVSGPQFKSSGILTPGGRFSVRLSRPGTIHYFCTIHPWMKATIVVSG